MSQFPFDSEQQSESLQPKITQSSSGNLGGQQASYGNNNSQYQDNRQTHIYLDLQDKNLEPLTVWGKILSYLKVFAFIVATLIFWVFFGLFTSFPFPYGQAIDLMLCCFKGTVASKVNRLQKRLQLENIDSQSIQRLNKFDFQARLYLEVLECLGANDAESHERLAKTIETLKRKKDELQNELKPRQLRKYRIVNRVQDFFDSVTLSQAERDLIQIESIIDEVTLTVRKNLPSEKIVQDTVYELSRAITRRADKTSPSRIGTLYRIEDLLRAVSDKEIYNLEESELENLNRRIISELKEEKSALSEEIKRLQGENNTVQQELITYLEELGKLNITVNERKTHLSSLQEKIKNYAEANQEQKTQINTMNLELTRANEEIKELQSQRNYFSKQISSLEQNIRQKQFDINKLNSSLKQYSEVRILEGQYIGNLSDEDSKYHFDQKCNHWKMLVGEYVLGLDPSRDIVSSNTPARFSGQLGECNRCAGSRN
ncbi:MAG: hypothetical protein LH702_03090 [Phormidesmis sp. CAN_BIN44]|nr:hypothetical protein [Phormidesmis sp. CAN_BIN44]